MQQYQNLDQKKADKCDIHSARLPPWVGFYTIVTLKSLAAWKVVFTIPEDKPEDLLPALKNGKVAAIIHTVGVCNLFEIN